MEGTQEAGEAQEKPALIPLTRGKFAVVDAADFEMLMRTKWHASRRVHSGIFYAAGEIDGVRVYMHRLLSGAKGGQCTDHRNGNSLDNRRCNLRIATRAENQMNQKGHGGTSKFKGVHKVPSGRWKVQIRCRNQVYTIGTFGTEEEGARAYDEAARRLHGEFARLNFSP